MTGWVMAYGPCAGCGRVFGFNPLRVPSITLNGQREAVCASCVARVNPRRVANGVSPIVPEPDAYEPVAESELP